MFRGNLPYTLVVLWCVAGRDLLHVLYCNYRPQHVSRLFSFTFLFRRGPFQCRPVAPNQRRPARLIARPMLRRLEPNSSYTCFFFFVSARGYISAPAKASLHVLVALLSFSRLPHGHSFTHLYVAPSSPLHYQQLFTLEPGDLLFTGTPAGVSPLAVGNCVEAKVEGLEPCRFMVGPPLPQTET